MCGINGALAFTTGGTKYLSQVVWATDALKRRGPDGNGVFRDEKVALGHCRLSIIDTSMAANQPMYAEAQRYVIVFNGEIFNFQELREKHLRQELFQTHSDTEVFLRLFAKLKEGAFPLLRGFFAAAIYDQQSKELYLVRDPFGKKPLLYFQSEEVLVFASEMKSLLAFGIPKKINWNLLPVYLQLNYVPQSYSLLEDVKKLEPGSYLKIVNSTIEKHRYYKLEKKPEQYHALSYEAAQQKLVTLMDEAVQLRLIADVPLGTFLSGGIDSSVVTALAARYTNKLKTFSIGYKDHPFFDETKYAHLVARKYNTDHTTFSLSNADFVAHVHSVLDYIDEPFADSSAIPEYILSYHTRKHVTVALSGDGGDEVFAGYNKHAGEWRLRYPDWKAKLVTALGPLWKHLPKDRSTKTGNLFRQLHRFSSASQLPASERYWRLASLLPASKATHLLSTATLDKINTNFTHEVKEQFAGNVQAEDFNDVLRADMNLVLVSDMLVKVDLMSMANSLEIRSPFVDQEVVEFAFGLPASYKVDGHFKKKIIQDAFRDLLPEALYNRPKRGFEIPLRDWLCNEFWSLIDNDLLKNSFIAEQNIFNVDAVVNLKRQLRSSNPGDSHATIWALIVFQYWWKKYFV